MKAVARVQGFSRHAPSPRLAVYRMRQEQSRSSFAEELRQSFGSRPRSTSPKFFYDSRGSGLFERICAQPEYYLTRAESEILGAKGSEIARAAGQARLVELGSGSSAKTRLILGALFGLHKEVEYVPIDISDVIEGSCGQLLRDYPGLSVSGIVGPYEEGLAVAGSLSSRPSLVAFLGSSLGNFDRQNAAQILRSIRATMGPNDSLLLGLDLAKGQAELEAAYNDAAGATAEFNLNILHRINAELGGNFDPGQFEHRAVYRKEAGRIEMYLQSKKGQRVSVPGAGLDVEMEKGELICTEYSHKYSPKEIRLLLEEAGLCEQASWQDSRGRFELALASPSGPLRRT